LDRYKYLDGSKIISQTDIDRISGSTRSVYTSADIQAISEEFVHTWEDRAQQQVMLPSSVRAYELITNNNQRVYLATKVWKVPNEEIYVYTGTNHLVIADGVATSTPFTVIVTQANLIVQGSLASEALYVVPQ
jgi:hypothetical protein